MTYHPILTIVAAGLGGWVINLAFLRAALPPPATQPFYYGLKRATAAAMGSLIWRGVSSLWSYVIALSGLPLVVLVMALGTALALYWAYSHLVVF
ncbi:MAG: hypothetical protein ACK4VY_09760 [Brevundimonas sp.]